MKKTLLKFCFCLSLLFFVFSLSTSSNANSIDSIDITVDIDSSGTAHVTEVWKADLDEGTEGYKPYGSLGDCEIKNFTVSDDSGTTYSNVSWNVNASFNNKKYKCGIREVNDVIELCWGISKYGDRTYYLEYDITNFVNQYTDCQGINFQLMPIDMDQRVGSASIEINFPYSVQDSIAEYYSFGYDGNITLKDGTIKLETSGALKSSNYMSIMVKFEDSYFYDTYDVDLTFEEDLKLAQDYEKQQEKNALKTIIKIILIVIAVILFAVLIIIFTYVYSAPQLVYEGTNKLPKRKEVNYWREIPADKDLFKAYWLAEKYNILSDKSGLIGAILLRWIQKGYITISKTKAGLFSLKDNNYAIDFTKFDSCEDSLENELLQFFKKASKENEILEANEFEKYCKTYYSKIETWFSKVSDEGTSRYEKEGLITLKPLEKKILFFHKTHSVRTASLQLKEEATKLLGLKKFLLDYSMIDDRTAIEVQLWEEYLIYAGLLGIADKVSEQFSKIYPDYATMSNLNTEFTTVAVTSLSHKGYSAAHNAYTSSQSSGSGGGSHGGSSGGGFR